MHPFLVRNRIRAALGKAGTAIAVAATLTGKPLSEPEHQFISREIRAPQLQKSHALQAEGIALLAGHVLDVVRVLASHNPEALEAAITIVNDAKIAEAEATEVSEIVEDREIAEPAGA